MSNSDTKSIEDINSIEDEIIFETCVEEEIIFETYLEALTYYRNFLMGNEKSCPTHDGPLEEESGIILQHLLKLNSKGVLSFDSQPGVINSSSKQRAYLAFFIENNLVSHITDMASKISDISVLVWSGDNFEDLQIYGNDFKPLDENGRFPLTMDSDVVFTSVSTAPDENAIYFIGEKILKNTNMIMVIDHIWGRESYIFDKLVEAFDR